MGKVTGFMEYQRLQEASEAPQERKKHYKEFVMHLSDDQAKVQGARCMDCGIPFCNSGCPVNNIIPDWNDLVYRGINEDPVGIKSIEHFIIDKGWENGWVKPLIAAHKTGKKVAVVGAGPAGMAAAQQLARAGHDVTLF